MPQTAKSYHTMLALVQEASLPQPWVVQYLKAITWYTGGMWLPNPQNPVFISFHKRLYRVLHRGQESPLHFVFWIACRTMEGVAELRTYNRLFGTGCAMDRFGEWVRKGGEDAEVSMAKGELDMCMSGLTSRSSPSLSEAKLVKGGQISDVDRIVAANHLVGLPQLRKVLPMVTTLLEHEGVEWI